MAISNRERYRDIAHFKRTGDLFYSDAFWQETLIYWVVREGAPEQITNNTWRGNYFGYDHSRGMREIISGLGNAPYLAGEVEAYLPIPPIVPQFQTKVVKEDEKHIILINQGGQTVRVLKNDPQKMPMYLDHPVKDWDSWKEYKKRLDPDNPERWPADWNWYVDKMNERDFPVILSVGSFFGFLREWMGMERLLYTFHDDPKLVEDMMETMLNLELEVIKRTVKDIKVDQANFWEDMCYKTGPLISPAMVKKFMVPRYRQITDLLRKNGIDIIYLDSDGNVTELIPLWLEAGINYIWPFEQAAGNDAVAARKKYGRDLIIGGTIDKRALIKSKEAVREEVMSKVPFLLEQGGYFPSVDHLVPPDVPFDNYKYYVNTMREVAGLEKLAFQ
jgi:uroporphyrinogen-III decarboxylase